MISLKGINFSRGDVVKIDGKVVIYAGSTYEGEETGFASHKFWNESYTSVSYLGLNNQVESFEWVGRPSYEMIASFLGRTVDQVDEMFSPENMKKVLEAVTEDLKKNPKW